MQSLVKRNSSGDLILYEILRHSCFVVGYFTRFTTIFSENHFCQVSGFQTGLCCMLLLGNAAVHPPLKGQTETMSATELDPLEIETPPSMASFSFIWSCSLAKSHLLVDLEGSMQRWYSKAESVHVETHT